MSAQPGCPFLDIYQESVSVRGKWYETTMADVLRQPPGLVIIAESLDASSGWLPQGGPSFAARKQALEQGLEETTEQLEHAGHDVVLVLPIYRFEDPPNLLTIDSRSLLSVLQDGSTKVIPIDRIDAEQVAVRDLIRSFGARNALPVIDLGDYQCPAGQCGLYYEGVPIYQDHSHVSAAFSTVLAPEFTKVMGSH